VIPIFRLILRSQLTKGRAAALATVALLGIGLAFAISRDSSGSFDRADAAYQVIVGFELGLLVPITALVFAAAALGDPAEDGTLVYLWHRPIPRTQIALASFAAVVAIAVPFAVVPTVIAAAVTGVGGSLVTAAAASSLLAVAAYSALFLWLGLVVRRALAWGLAYVLIWEGFVARSGTGPARLSILVYARSLLASLADHDPPRLAASVPFAVGVPLVLAAIGVAATVFFLRRIDVR
jgi:ABC-2 type transport system permease protein